MCRLGLLLFFTQARRHFGVAPNIGTDIYIQKLIPLLEVQTDWVEFNMLKLWAMSLGAMQAKIEKKKVLVSMMKELLGILGVKSHAKAKDRLRELLWIGEIHGINFWELLYRDVWMVVA